MDSPSERSSSPPVSEGIHRLRAVRHVVLDMDGTVYLGSRVFPWTGPFLALLRDLGIGHTFITNNNSRGPEDWAARLRGMGVAAEPSEIYTSTLATIEHLRERSPAPRRLFILGTESLRGAFRQAGFEEVDDGDAVPEMAGFGEACGAGEDEGRVPDAVVVGFDTSLSYPRLCRAAWWIRRGIPFLATHPDRVCPTEAETVLPDCGSICALLAHATGRAPDIVLGKPSPRMVEGAVRGKGVRLGEVAVVGDRIYTDMRMARESGALAVLVLSGETTREDLAEDPAAADIVVSDLAELGDLLRRAHGAHEAP